MKILCFYKNFVSYFEIIHLMVKYKNRSHEEQMCVCNMYLEHQERVVIILQQPQTSFLQSKNIPGSGTYRDHVSQHLIKALTRF